MGSSPPPVRVRMGQGEHRDGGQDQRRDDGQRDDGMHRHGDGDGDGLPTGSTSPMTASPR